MYEQYAAIIQEKYPNIAIYGDNYPPPNHRMQLAQVLGIGKLLLMGLIIGSVNPFLYIGLETPSFFNWFLQNKIYSCAMIYFISNLFENQLISTGAFEIAFNDVPVWSKIDTGRVPSLAELFQIIDSNMRFKA